MKKKRINKISNKEYKLHLKPLFDDTELFEVTNYNDKDIEELTEDDKKEIDKLIEQIIN